MLRKLKENFRGRIIYYFFQIIYIFFIFYPYVFSTYPSRICTKSEFKCKLDNNCIPLIKWQDGYEDCIDGSDEVCLPWQFDCKFGYPKCISSTKINDGSIDCMSGFDESCPSHYFVCKDKSKCLDPQKYMDGVIDCNDSSDEPCPEGKFLCHDTSKCISISQFQNGIPDCNDGSDEECTVTQFQCACKGKIKCIEIEKVYNGIKDCDDGSDEGFFPNNGFCSDGSKAIIQNEKLKIENEVASISTCPINNPCSERLGLVCLTVGGTWRCVCKVGTVKPPGSSRCIPIEMLPQFFAKPDVNCTTVYNDMLIQYRQFYSNVPRIQFKEDLQSEKNKTSKIISNTFHTTNLKNEIFNLDINKHHNDPVIINTTSINIKTTPKPESTTLNLIQIKIKKPIDTTTIQRAPVKRIKTTDNILEINSSKSKKTLLEDFSDFDLDSSFYIYGSECDPYMSMSCSNINGTCIKNNNQTFTCQCKDNEVLNPITNKCTVLIDECSNEKLNDCDKNAICMDNDFSYECLCREGYIDVSLSPISKPGIKCKKLVNECKNSMLNDCDKNSICIDKPNGYTCRCLSDFTDTSPDRIKKPGRKCQKLINECQIFNGTICDPIAYCIDLPIGYKCSCPKGTLDISTDYLNNPGTKCLSIPDECKEHLCNPKTSVCIKTIKKNNNINNEGDRYECQCKPGYQDNDITRPGFNCTKKGPDPCLDFSLHDCDPVAACYSEPNGFFNCRCPKGFVDISPDSRFPGRKCKKAVDECSLGIHECDSNADCLDTSTSYNCRCRTGFADVSPDPLNKPGRHCKKANQCSTSDCHAAAECRESPSGPICQCTSGFVDVSRQHGRPPGRICREIINECTTNAHDCSPSAYCIDTSESFTCRCKDGYRDESTNSIERPGRVCVKSSIPDAPECNVNDPLSCDKLKHEVCLFINSNYKCVCPQGYERLPDGRCLVINECKDKKLNNCHDNAECIDLPDGFSCRCKSGFIDISPKGQIGRLCKERINECLSPEKYNVDCNSNAICIDTDSSYECKCKPGFVDISERYRKLPGRKCLEAINECSNNSLNDCSENAICEDTKESYICTCKPGYIDVSFNITHYSGRVCVKPNNNNNNINQINNENKYINYEETKKFIEKKCSSTSNCGNNEICKLSSEKIKTCQCNENCIRDIDGKCKKIESCEGYNECDINAICSNIFGGYKCQCRPGYYDISTDPIRKPGRMCKELINECGTQANTCSPFAECIDSIDGYSCSCLHNFVDISSIYGLEPGRKCVKTINECSSTSLHTCDENADCIDTEDSYTCQCYAGFIDVSSSANLPPGRVCTVETSCSKQKTDLIFLIDGSGSIGSRVFKSEVLRFIAEFVELFDISPTKTRVGLIQYSDQIRHEFDLNQYKDKTSLLNAISNIQYLTGLTRTGAAIQHMVNEGFSISKGARPLSSDISRVAIIMTDGRSQDNVTNPSITARYNNIKTFSIGVTDHVLPSELESIAGSQKNWFYVSKFKDLDTRLRSLIQKATCPRIIKQSNLHGKCNVETQTGCNRELNEICIMVNGKASCECTKPFIRNPVTKICGGDLCNPQLSTSCIYPELCHKTPLNNYRCICPDGYDRESITGRCLKIESIKDVKQIEPPLKEKTCNDIDGIKCSETEICTLSSNTYICECNRGYERNPFTGKCQIIGSCNPSYPYNCDLRKHEHCLLHPSGKYHSCQCNKGEKRHIITGICLRNECQTGEHDCDRNARCIDTDEGFICSCPYGYIDHSPEPIKRPGRLCIPELDECSTGKHNCSPDAICIDTTDGYICRCKPGYIDFSPNPLINSGIICKPLINECEKSYLNTCHQDAFCIDTSDSYKCICKSGYEDMDPLRNPGRKCYKPQMEDICSIGSHSCDKNAKCISKSNGEYTCICNPGFIDKSPNKNDPGKVCIPLIHECDNPSLNDCDSPDRAICIDNDEGYNCQCRQGFLDISPNLPLKPGRLCKILENECFSGNNDCAKDGGICEDTPDSYLCRCTHGYLDVSYDIKNRPGRKCKRLIDECLTRQNDCSPDAICTDTEDSYICACPSQYIDVSSDIINKPGRRCLLRINECLTNQNDCSVNADCLDTPESYKCKCKDNFIDESPDKINKPGRICRPTYINECNNGMNDCHKDALCHDLPQGYLCQCKSGFIDDSPNRIIQPGRKCIPKPIIIPDECKIDNINSCKSHLNEVCRLINGVPKCTCPINYERNKKSQICNIINECLYSQLNDCHPFAECIDTENGYECKCKNGYKDISPLKKNGRLCQPIINECQFPHLNDCHINAICIDTDENFECKCKSNFKDMNPKNPGRICKEFINECNNSNLNSCDKNAYCIDKEDGYECHCKEGYLDISPSPSFLGRACRELIDECRDKNKNDCDKIAKCIDTQDSYKCICPLNSKDISPNPAFPGRVCLQYENECLSGKHDCDSNAICHDNEQGFTCECPSGYIDRSPNKMSRSGRVCVKLIDECSSGRHTCSPKAECRDLEEGYTCECKNGYVDRSPNMISQPGRVCSIPDICPQTNECSSAAICEPLENNDYKCTCIQGYNDQSPNGLTGRICIRNNACRNPSLNNCSRNSICYNERNGYRCECIQGYEDKSPIGSPKGRICEEKQIQREPIYKHPCQDPQLHDCHINANCRSTGKDTYTCECSHGFVDHSPDIINQPGRVCNKANLVCLDSTKNDCDPYGICIENNSNDGYTCKCRDGYIDQSPNKILKPGRVCTELINECLDKSLNDCHSTAVCEDLPEGYTCRCAVNAIDQSPDKIHRPGRICYNPINECSNPTLNDCSKFSDCIDQIEGYLCKCKKGYYDLNPSKPGRQCKFIINECESRTLNDCDINAICIDTPGGYECKCKSPYKDESPISLPGRMCRFNECLLSSTNNCDKNADCIDTDDNYICRCRNGFYDSSPNPMEPGRLCLEFQNEPSTPPTEIINDHTISNEIIIKTKIPLNEMTKGTIKPKIYTISNNDNNNNNNIVTNKPEIELFNKIICGKTYCNINLNEVCINGWYCDCKPNEGRGSNSEICRIIQKTYIPLRVIAKDNEPIYYSSSYGNPTNPVYIQFAEEFNKDIGKSFAGTTYATKFVNSKISYITHPKMVNSSWPDGILVNFTVGTTMTEKKVDQCDMWDQLIQSLQRTNGHIGGGKLTVPSDVDLLNPCNKQQINGDKCGNEWCNKELGEICIANSICGCPDGEKRKNNKDKCYIVENFQIPMWIIRDGEKNLIYNDSYENPQDIIHKNIATRYENGIGNCYSHTDLKDFFITAEVNDITNPKIINGTWDTGLLYNTSVYFKKGAIKIPQDVYTKVIDYIIKQNNYEVGDSDLFINPTQPNPYDNCYKNHCHEKGICIPDIPHGYHCECGPGFRDLDPILPGRKCLPIKNYNECLKKEDNECSENARCIDQEYLYKCECFKGYTDAAPKDAVPGSVCVMDYCADVNFCPKNTTCVNMEQQAECRCDHGFMDIRKSELRDSTGLPPDTFCMNIRDVNECALGLTNCSGIAECTDKIIGYECKCPDTYIDGNPNEPGRMCASISCGYCNYHGDCVHNEFTRNITCSCNDGWSGELCDIEPSKASMILLILLALLFLLLTLCCLLYLCTKCYCFKKGPLGGVYRRNGGGIFPWNTLDASSSSESGGDFSQMSTTGDIYNHEIGIPRPKIKMSGSENTEIISSRYMANEQAAEKFTNYLQGALQIPRPLINNTNEGRNKRIIDNESILSGSSSDYTIREEIEKRITTDVTTKEIRTIITEDGEEVEHVTESSRRFYNNDNNIPTYSSNVYDESNKGFNEYTTNNTNHHIKKDIMGQEMASLTNIKDNIYTKRNIEESKTFQETRITDEQEKDENEEEFSIEQTRRWENGNTFHGTNQYLSDEDSVSLTSTDEKLVVDKVTKHNNSRFIDNNGTEKYLNEVITTKTSTETRIH
uniref:EGF-like domain-containing protein n=1 Tax=Strongyloides stercoralis TaxID=6248 RepID=A0A913I4D2_STRER